MREVTGEPLALGLLGLVEAARARGLVLFGGHVADRRDRCAIIIHAAEVDPALAPVAEGAERPEG
jgi:hypothetical protein